MFCYTRIVFALGSSEHMMLGISQFNGTVRDITHQVRFHDEQIWLCFAGVLRNPADDQQDLLMVEFHRNLAAAVFQLTDITEVLRTVAKDP